MTDLSGSERARAEMNRRVVVLSGTTVKLAAA
eukprot:COSAG02_NODE_4966_length_4774_cov_7.241925_2_plen_32_part_00